MLRPFSSATTSHTRPCSQSVPPARFCRLPPPLFKYAILAPRSRPFHLTGFTSGLGLQGSEATYRRICCRSSSIFSTPCDLTAVLARLRPPSDPIECAARAQRSRSLAPPFSTLTPTTATEPASALTRIVTCRSLFSRSLLCHTYRHPSPTRGALPLPSNGVPAGGEEAAPE